MSITSRRYTDDDMPRLQAALGGWIHEAGDCGYCHVGEIPERIYTGQHGLPPVDQLVSVWEAETDIIGFAINLRFDNAFEVYTDPAYRGTDVESQMLQSTAERTRQLMRRLGRDEPSVIIDVWDCDINRQQLLDQLGFEKYRVWGYLAERSLSDPLPEPRVAEGFIIRSSTTDDYEQLATVRNAAFAMDLRPEDYRDGVMQKPGYDPAHEFIVIAPDGRFAAFAKIWLDDRNQVGLFEPVGTHREFQRRGLGRALMLYGMHRMKRYGMKTVMIGYDATNSPAESLYERLGFRRKHTILGYRKA